MYIVHDAIEGSGVDFTCGWSNMMIKWRLDVMCIISDISKEGV